jgi:hypothetical protein
MTELPGTNWHVQRDRISASDRAKLRVELGSALHWIIGAGFGYPQGKLVGIDAIRSVVVDCFAHENRPDADAIHVGFDSSVRVAENGGWHYFR